MKNILFKILGRAGGLADVPPVLALFLGGAFLAVFLTALLRAKSPVDASGKSSLLWTLYHQCGRWLWALMLISLLAGALTTLRNCLHRTLAEFERSHGRVTEANFNAVQTIWGAEQTQNELGLEMYYEEEATERIESEDLTKPAVLRKKIVRHDITANPFVAARHEVTLRQNPRKKGSAYYTGYETACRFSWRLKNPTARDLKAVLTFPLPAAGAMYDALTATLNGKDILPQMQLKDSALTLARDLKPDEQLDLNVSFTSRGMSFWYFQSTASREIRDFTLMLNLPDLPKAKLNYPDGCMTPTEIKPAKDGAGSVLTYRLDHAISNKGMGIALPTLPQPGETTNAVLREVETGWLLIFAALILGLTLAEIPHSALLGVLFCTATACGYGLLGDFSDLLPGFWSTAALVIAPIFALLAWLLTRVARNLTGRLLAAQLLLYGLAYPGVAGLDSARQTLYFNLCALLLLTFTTWLLVENLKLFRGQPQSPLSPAAQSA
jgi:hypothetical protein